MASLLSKLKKAKPTEAPKSETTFLEKFGAKVYNIKRRHLAEPVIPSFGLTLLEDNEVTAVAENSICSDAQLPTGHVILYVNDKLVEDNYVLYEECGRHLDVILYVFDMAGINELESRVIEEPTLPDFQELLKTTPRYAFLDIKHPLYRLWEARFNRAKDTKDALQKDEEIAARERQEEEVRRAAEEEAQVMAMLNKLTNPEITGTRGSAEHSAQASAQVPAGREIGKKTPVPADGSHPLKSGLSFFNTGKDDDEDDETNGVNGRTIDDDLQAAVLGGQQEIKSLSQGDEDGVPVVVEEDLLNAVLLAPSSLQPKGSDQPSGLPDPLPEKVQEEPALQSTAEHGRPETTDQGIDCNLEIKPAPPTECPPHMRIREELPAAYRCSHCDSTGKHWSDTCPTVPRQNRVVVPVRRAPSIDINQPRKSLCKDFLRGDCRRGVNCVYLHDFDERERRDRERRRDRSPRYDRRGRRGRNRSEEDSRRDNRDRRRGRSYDSYDSYERRGRSHSRDDRKYKARDRRESPDDRDRAPKRRRY